MRMVEAGISKEISQKKTGRVSDRADQDYIETSRHEKRMSEALHSGATTIESTGEVTQNQSEFSHPILYNSTFFHSTEHNFRKSPIKNRNRK